MPENRITLRRRRIQNAVNWRAPREAADLLAEYPAAQIAEVLQELNPALTAGEITLGEVIEFLANDVVARHMLTADREFSP